MQRINRCVPDSMNGKSLLTKIFYWNDSRFESSILYVVRIVDLTKKTLLVPDDSGRKSGGGSRSFVKMEGKHRDCFYSNQTARTIQEERGLLE